MGYTYSPRWGHRRRPYTPTVTTVIAAFLLCGLAASLSITANADSTIVNDSFTRAVVDGWGSATTGGTYSLTGAASDFDVNGSAGTMNASSPSTSRAAVLSDVSQLNQDITVKIAADKTAAGISQEAFLISRQVNATTMYRGKLRLTPSNAVTVQASKVVSGTETFLGGQVTVAGLTNVANIPINVRMAVSGSNPTTIQIKAWSNIAAEPATWNYTATDSEAGLQAAGSPGLRVNLPGATSNAPILFSFDDFTVITSDAVTPPDPTPPPQTGLTLLSDTFSRNANGGWGTSDSGGEYFITSGSSTSFGVNGSVGTIASPSPATVRTLMLSSKVQQDIDLKLKFKIDKLPTGNAMELYLQSRSVSPGDMYRGKIRLTNSGSMTVQAAKVIGGNETALGLQTTTGVILASNTFYYARTQVVGLNPTTIHMKVWPESDVEPVNWQYTVTDSEPTLQADGGIGFRTNAPSTISNAPLLMTFDDINATTHDASLKAITAPEQAGTVIATDAFARTTVDGWGAANTGGNYSISSGSNTRFATNGSIGTIVDSGQIYLPDTSQQNIDHKVKVKIDKLPLGNTVEAQMLIRRINPNLHYRAKVRFTPAGGVSLLVASVVNGTETNLSSSVSSGITYAADTYIWVRTQISDASPTTIYMKAWLDGATEPIDWQYIVNDYSESVLQDAGAVGFRTNIPISVTNTPIITTFDDLNVTTTDSDIYDPSNPPQPDPAPPIPASVQATVGLEGPQAVSQLSVGATHTQESIVSGGDAAAIVDAKSLLANGLDYQNQHIIGWGADNLWDDPSKDPSQWNWSSLDRRVAVMRDTNTKPILTLCCAPTWMVDETWTPGKYNGSNTDWGQLAKAPLDTYESEFVYMIEKIVERYNGTTLDSNGVAFPRVTRFQVWNEMKGFWSRDLNRWNYEKYNRIYGLTYDTIKQLRPDTEIGGPYVRLGKWLYPSGVKNSPLSDPSYGTVDKRDMEVVTKWLEWLNANRDSSGNLKAQFLVVDGNLNVKDITNGTFPTNLWGATKFYADANSWMKGQMTDTIGTTLPIWWAEDYVGKVNGDPAGVTAEQYQPSLLATMLTRHALGGTATSLRWGPEEQLSSSGVRQGNRQNLYTSTKFAGGGQPYDNYAVYKYFHDHFSDGTGLYPVTLAPSTNYLTVLASSTKALLINSSSDTINVALTANSSTVILAVQGYKVLLTDIPSPASTEPPAPTPSSPPKKPISQPPQGLPASVTTPSPSPDLPREPSRPQDETPVTEDDSDSVPDVISGDNPTTATQDSDRPNKKTSMAVTILIGAGIVSVLTGISYGVIRARSNDSM